MSDTREFKSPRDEQIKQGNKQADPAQAEAIRLLQQIAGQLEGRTPLPYDSYTHNINQTRINSTKNNTKKNGKIIKARYFFFWIKKVTDGIGASQPKTARFPGVDIKGLYLWGDVGRGKTWLMDQFYAALPIEDKIRLHYHQFMANIHRSLESLYAQADPLDVVARRMADKHRLICLDEFHVIDIADAVILHGLLRALFKHGVTLITTSNRHPDALYSNGTHRERFLPAIELIKANTHVFELDYGKDYRLHGNIKPDVFFSPQDQSTQKIMDKLFHDFQQREYSDDSTPQTSKEPKSDEHTIDHNVITISGRQIPVIKKSSSIIWFDFNTLCRGPRSSRDYIQIAKQYRNVILSDIPRLHIGEEAPARRFLNLIDEFYDQHVFLILSSEVALNEIYLGELLQFEFQRALSRLQEMQSDSYWDEAAITV